MQTPMPMMTLFKTLDVTWLVKLSKQTGMKFNMQICWCIGRAANVVNEFYMLPVSGRMMKFDALAVNTIMMNREGEGSSCDIPFSTDLQQFSEDYLQLTAEVRETCQNHDITDAMVIGTARWSNTKSTAQLVCTATFSATRS